MRKIPCLVTVHHALVSSSPSLSLSLSLSPFTLSPFPDASIIIIRFGAYAAILAQVCLNKIVFSFDSRQTNQSKDAHNSILLPQARRQTRSASVPFSFTLRLTSLHEQCWGSAQRGMTILAAGNGRTDGRTEGRGATTMATQVVSSAAIAAAAL